MSESVERVAALYDIHGNLPALEAVLTEVRNAGVDRILIGGDVLPGPMPCETLDLLRIDQCAESPVGRNHARGFWALGPRVEAWAPYALGPCAC